MRRETAGLKKNRLLTRVAMRRDMRSEVQLRQRNTADKCSTEHD